MSRSSLPQVATGANICLSETETPMYQAVQRLRSTFLMLRITFKLGALASLFGFRSGNRNESKAPEEGSYSIGFEQKTSAW